MEDEFSKSVQAVKTDIDTKTKQQFAAGFRFAGPVVLQTEGGFVPADDPHPDGELLATDFHDQINVNEVVGLIDRGEATSYPLKVKGTYGRYLLLTDANVANFRATYRAWKESRLQEDWSFKTRQQSLMAMDPESEEARAEFFSLLADNDARSIEPFVMPN